MRKPLLAAMALVSLPIAALAQNVVTVAGGSSYHYATDGDGQITAIANDDGATVAYEYDDAGNEVGVQVLASGAAVLSVRYMSEGTDQIVWAPGLPAILVSSDSNGRTSAIRIHPELVIGDGGVLEAVEGPAWAVPAPTTAATLSYDTNGYLTQATLHGGLALQLGTSDSAGNVHQTLYGATGNVLAQATAVGSASGVRIVPAQLDAVANEFGLGGTWADTLIFQTTADGHLTTARDAGGTAVLYMVNAGPYRVGFSPDGTALFYDIEPNYEAMVAGAGPEVAPDLSGVAPNHIVITASGQTGFYLDRPADGALYTAWNEVDAAGNVTQPYAVLEAPSALSRKQFAATNGSRMTPRANYVRNYSTTVCADGQCWTRYWSEWIEDASGASGGGASPGGGGTPAAKTGNQLIGNPLLRAKVDRALKSAADKLKQSQCQALLNQPDAIAIANPNTAAANRTLGQNMKNRGYSDPSVYLTRGLTYVAGTTPKQCPGGSDTKASTNVWSTTIAVCPSFNNGSDPSAAIYLIHEMLHSLGLPESPTQGAKTSAQISDEVRAACGGQ